MTSQKPPPPPPGRRPPAGMSSRGVEPHQRHTATNQDLPVQAGAAGGHGVGKSSLVLRFVKGQFDEFQETTIGAAFLAQSVCLDDTTVKFEIWDTAGQERYHSLAPMYYRGAQAAIVVFDITKPDTFERAKAWVKELQRQASPNIVIALAGNKADLAERRLVEYEGELKRRKSTSLTPPFILQTETKGEETRKGRVGGVGGVVTHSLRFGEGSVLEEQRHDLFFPPRTLTARYSSGGKTMADRCPPLSGRARHHQIQAPLQSSGPPSSSSLTGSCVPLSVCRYPDDYIVQSEMLGQDTFERAKAWVKELQRQASPNIVIALAGNKADLAERRLVEYEDAQTYAEDTGLLFMETSAKTAMNVNELFLAIAKKMPKTDTQNPTHAARHRGGELKRRKSTSLTPPFILQTETKGEETRKGRVGGVGGVVTHSLRFGEGSVLEEQRHDLFFPPRTLTARYVHSFILQ
ncbi:hypothetical protein F7725_002487 [Dissostichus mawsoni]|uniref:Uncharacterized protein n=1 Tax=Dissostichus mawsoni TaxID=36200 RepID=A0A7J5Y5N7_DISMA|nr:hypothetical protein F7725_002487 [Dissostichus mawsoni]